MFKTVAILLFLSSFQLFADSILDELIYSPEELNSYQSPIEPFHERGLPDDVVVRDGKQGFSYEYLYALDDQGRIWIKPSKNNETDRSSDWKPFLDKGYPFGKKFELDADEKIVEFQTEGTMIMALSNKRKFYKFQPTLKRETLEWEAKMGTPLEETLYLPRAKAWTFAFSVSRQPQKRITPMHENDIVSYWEDYIGNKIEFGLTATVYTLDEDGTLIRFWDTGLPASFSRTFSTPERGRFVAENIAASASVVFVINKKGEMYTRIYDYELNPGCPGLDWSYYTGKKEDKILPLYGHRVAPTEDWIKHAPIKLEGEAAITKEITILLTGKGNKARELRVSGLGPSGEQGYYKKALTASTWEFVAANLHQEFDQDEYLQTDLEESAQGKMKDAAFSGIAKLGMGTKLSARFVDFYPYHSPSTLRFYVDNKSFDVLVHTTDAWSLVVQNKQSEQLIGKHYGSFQMLLGTLEIPNEVMNSQDKEIKKIVDKYLKDLHLKMHAFTIFATDAQVTMYNRKIYRESHHGYFDYSWHKKIKMDLKRDDKSDLIDGFTHLTTKQNLILDLPNKPKLENLPYVKARIERNTALLNAIKELNHKLKIDSLKQATLTTLAAGVIHPLSAILQITNLTKNAPLGEIVTFGGVILRGNAKLNLIMLADSDDYENAVTILKARIKEYEAIAKEIEKPFTKKWWQIF